MKKAIAGLLFLMFVSVAVLDIVLASTILLPLSQFASVHRDLRTAAYHLVIQGGGSACSADVCFRHCHPIASTNLLIAGCSPLLHCYSAAQGRVYLPPSWSQQALIRRFWHHQGDPGASALPRCHVERLCHLQTTYCRPIYPLELFLVPSTS